MCHSTHTNPTEVQITSQRRSKEDGPQVFLIFKNHPQVFLIFNKQPALNWIIMFRPRLLETSANRESSDSCDKWDSYTFFGVLTLTIGLFTSDQRHFSNKPNEQEEIRRTVPSTGKTYKIWEKIKTNRKSPKPFCLKKPPAYFNAYNSLQQETLQYESQLSFLWLVLLCLLPSMG